MDVFFESFEVFWMEDGGRLRVCVVLTKERMEQNGLL